MVSLGRISYGTLNAKNAFMPEEDPLGPVIRKMDKPACPFLWRLFDFTSQK